MRKVLLAAVLLFVPLFAGCTDDDDSVRVVFETSKGDFVVKTLPEHAPKTVTNFLRYVDEGFYSGTIFHRIGPDFVIQGGGFLPSTLTRPNGAYQKPTHEPVVNEATLDEPNSQFTLSMARTQAPDSATSQFFINVVDNDALDPGGVDPRGYAVFAKVVEGFDTIEALRTATPGVWDQSHSTHWPAENLIVHRAYREGKMPDAGDGVEAGAITPGVWAVNATQDHLLVWARNTDGHATANVSWRATAPGGGALPAGWTIAFEDASQELGRHGYKVVGADKSVAYSDWHWTLATITVPADATGTTAIILHANEATPVEVDVDVSGTSGEVSASGDHIEVQYRGTFTDSEEEFDSGAFDTTLGLGQTVPGFDFGLMGLSVGESATLVLPPALGYGYDTASTHLKFQGESLTFEVTRLADPVAA